MTGSARTAIKAVTRNGLRQAIIYEDNHLIAINKWRALAVQDATQSDQTLMANLHLLKQNDHDPLPKLAHRLDRNTTGVLLLAKSQLAISRLNHLFSKRAISKEYLAVVMGKPRSKSGLLKGLGSAEQSADNKLFTPRGGQESTHDYWQNAQSRFEVLRHSSKHELSLIRLHPRSGYKHQLRIQCSELLQCPVFGDARYGGNQCPPYLRAHLKRHGMGSDKHPHGVLMHLHAAKLTVPGYLANNKDLVLSAPLPEHMLLTIQSCQLHPKDDSIVTRPQPSDTRPSNRRRVRDDAVNDDTDNRDKRNRGSHKIAQSNISDSKGKRDRTNNRNRR
eukprot:TRINITY_DN8514_c0_g1_i1.p1 TRINITY_DN8514_c0_g1~~TRINITY_DN8514_c0_g1_i1.p1  ORF type:complete len:333 (+),score=49.94 TRINITY_DN8514_c0_g1_i1:69-1067(+)